MQLYDTLSRSKRTFQPLNNNEVGFYSCGLTVYSQPHIGNWVGYIYWDVLQRLLTHHGFNVKRVQNITDVGHLVSDDDSGEDKLEKGARREGMTAWQVADKYIAIADHEAFELLGLLKPELIRATDLIQEQIKFVQELEQKGLTYVIEDDGVYFDTSSLQNYGQLARLDIEGLKSGARVANKHKRNPTDFAVWKFSPKDQTRDMQWQSPWGLGFPGWHLECSVIARQALGDQLDIHVGGVDHIPVHHTNEIAQTESITNRPMAAFWLHNNHLKVEGQKMSKSLGNVYTLQDIIAHEYEIEAFKLLILSKHYRTEGNFTWEILATAQNRLNNLRHLSQLIHQQVELPDVSDKLVSIKQAFIAAIDDDLNTPEALSGLSALDDLLAHGLPEISQDSFYDLLQTVDNLLGLSLSQEPDISAEVKNMIEARLKARHSKDWVKSDEIRDQLLKQGISLRDFDSHSLWSRTNNVA